MTDLEWRAPTGVTRTVAALDPDARRLPCARPSCTCNYRGIPPAGDPTAGGRIPPRTGGGSPFSRGPGALAVRTPWRGASTRTPVRWSPAVQVGLVSRAGGGGRSGPMALPFDLWSDTPSTKRDGHDGDDGTHHRPLPRTVGLPREPGRTRGRPGTDRREGAGRSWRIPSRRAGLRDVTAFSPLPALRHGVAVSVVRPSANAQSTHPASGEEGTDEGRPPFLPEDGETGPDDSQRPRLRRPGSPSPSWRQRPPVPSPSPSSGWAPRPAAWRPSRPFFRHVPTDIGMAFVVVSHLDPEPREHPHGDRPAHHGASGGRGDRSTGREAQPHLRHPAESRPRHLPRHAPAHRLGGAARAAHAHRRLLPAARRPAEDPR